MYRKYNEKFYDKLYILGNVDYALIHNDCWDFIHIQRIVTDESASKPVDEVPAESDEYQEAANRIQLVINQSKSPNEGGICDFFPKNNGIASVEWNIFF